MNCSGPRVCHPRPIAKVSLSRQPTTARSISLKIKLQRKNEVLVELMEKSTSTVLRFSLGCSFQSSVQPVGEVALVTEVGRVHDEGQSLGAGDVQVEGNRRVATTHNAAGERRLPLPCPTV